jgi:DMSO/TMAO reductase YedYZ molybdopterin-dependent catalytic subunit
VPLGAVLELAGIRSDAVHVCPEGLDRNSPEGPVRCPLPVAKALDPDTLIALRMNGEVLPPDHGFPARILAPGWLGTYSVKWLGRIHVSTRRLWVTRNTEMYVLMGPAWPAERYLPARGAPITAQTIKSSLALPWPARLDPGRHRIHGYARAPEARIIAVQWSADGGATWRMAELVPPNLRYAWVQFRFEWDARPGEHALMTRARDEAGNVQPLSVPFNDGGYVFNMVHPHPVIVAAGS